MYKIANVICLPIMKSFFSFREKKLTFSNWNPKLIELIKSLGNRALWYASSVLKFWLNPESVSELSQCKIAIIYFYLTYVIARIPYDVK